MDILGNLRRLESSLASTVDEATQRVTKAGPREPLEVLHALVDRVEKRIEPAGRGRYVFPFDRIRICIAAGSADTRARFEAVLELPPALQDRIIERLQVAGCESTGLSVSTKYAERADPEWTTPHFNIEFDRVTQAAPQSLKLITDKGVTDKPFYVFTSSCITLGRGAEVRDGNNRLIRTNHAIFAETGEEPNATVSRNHAHIDRSETLGEYRLYDDRSAHGTCVLRNGHTIVVPPGPRGVRLQSGDEIMLGGACLRVEME